MNIAEAIAVLDKHVPNPSTGLPDELFYYISKTTPLVNVDLLIKDEKGRTLLSWRNDQYCGRGWHIPGGIVRLKETLEARVKKVANLSIMSVT
jgi:colanic acid biosynthesis protein WcaH